MKVLFISTSLPPNYDSQTIRNLHFIKGLVRAGLVVDTITVSDFKITNQLDTQDYTNGTCYKTELPFILIFLSRIKNRFIRYLFHNVLNITVAPDLYLGWDKIIKKNIYSKISNEKYEAIISASGSYYAHIVAKDFSKKINVPLICDLGDPWADNPIWPENIFHKKIINSFLERSVLDVCSLLITTNHNTTTLYQQKYGIDNVISIPMGFNKRDHSDLSIKTTIEKINMSYIGVAYKKSRDLTHLINAVGRNDKFVLDIVGPHSVSFDKIPDEKGYVNIFLRGKVSYEESEKLVNLSDVSVVLGNTGGLQIPGKLYSLLGVPKTLLYIYQDKSDPAIKILQNFEGVITVSNDLSSISDALIFIHENIIEYQDLSKKRAISEITSSYDWCNVSDLFANCVLNTIRKDE